MKKPPQTSTGPQTALQEYEGKREEGPRYLR